jgi:hypothetical protein
MESAVPEEKPDPILESLRKEISETQSRREKLQLLKIAFVSALLGFGGGGIKEISPVYQGLYVVPLITTFFDLLIQGEHFSIRRAGTFLRLNSPSQLTKDYEMFVSKNRDVFFKFGSAGFSSLSYFASIVLLRKSNYLRSWVEWVWFAVLFLIFISSLCYTNRRLKELDRLERNPERRPSGQGAS